MLGVRHVLESFSSRKEEVVHRTAKFLYLGLAKLKFLKLGMGAVTTVGVIKISCLVKAS